MLQAVFCCELFYVKKQPLNVVLCFLKLINYRKACLAQWVVLFSSVGGAHLAGSPGSPPHHQADWLAEVSTPAFSTLRVEAARPEVVGQLGLRLTPSNPVSHGHCTCTVKCVV